MSEIRLNVDDRYLQTFLGFLKTLNYVEVSKVSKTPDLKEANQNILLTLPVDDPLRMALNTPIQSTNIEDALLNRNYQKTDLIKLGLLAEELAIPESAEELIAQLEG